MITSNPVADRYAGAFFEMAKQRGQLEEAWQHLQELKALILEHPDLRQLLLNPDVEGADKLRVLNRVSGGAWSADLQAFLRLVLERDRAQALVDIVGAFDQLVDAERGRLRVTIRSAHPLPDKLKDRIKQRLARWEHREIELTEETDPSLIGGLQVLLDHRLLDGSIKHHLEALRHRLKSVRVY